jgi:ubiquinone/menaquinone biosynthesis C-methylase UbiE
MRVLDAATGTGFVALAIAKAVGPRGSVVGVDVSRGMLREASASVRASGLTTIELIEADAVCLAQYEPGTFDAVTCGTGLLYMSVPDALREWHRLLRRGGLIAFSALESGSPRGALIFRDCASRFGVVLRDPLEELGTIAACRTALEHAGFTVTSVVSETVNFSPTDVAKAWESNFTSASHPELRGLAAHDAGALRSEYLDALAREESAHPGALTQAGVLYAVGRAI